MTPQNNIQTRAVGEMESRWAEGRWCEGSWRLFLWVFVSAVMLDTNTAVVLRQNETRELVEFPGSVQKTHLNTG